MMVQTIDVELFQSQFLFFILYTLCILCVCLLDKYQRAISYPNTTTKCIIANFHFESEWQSEDISISCIRFADLMLQNLSLHPA